MDYRDNPQHRVGVNIKVVEFYSAFWTDFAPPLTLRGDRLIEDAGKKGPPVGHAVQQRRHLHDAVVALLEMRPRRRPLPVRQLEDAIRI